MKHRLTLFTFLALFAVFTHCTAARGVSVWGEDGEQLSSELRAGNYNALQHISFDDHRLEEVLRLGEDASFAVGLIYRELGMPDVAADLLRLAWEEAPPPYRREALVELAALLTEGEEFRELSSLGEEAIERDVDPLYGRSLLIRGLYEREQWNEVLEHVDVLVNLAREDLPPHSLLRQESLLWRAISLARVEEQAAGRDRPAWAQEILSLFTDYPATVMHARVWLFLLFSDAHRSAFTEQELRYFQAKQLLAEGSLSEAAELFGQVAADAEARALMLLPYGVFDYFRAAAASGSTALQLEAAAVLQALAEDVDASIAARTLEYSGRLYRATSRFSQAIDTLENALEAVEPGDSDQRIQWYLLSSRVRENPELAADTVGVLVAELEQPSYFSDVLAELGERLIADASWRSLLQAYQGIENFATPGTLARYQLVLGRVYAQGRLPATSSRARELRANYLERAASQNEDRFSAMVAGALLGADAENALRIEDGAAPDPPRGNEQEEASEAADALAQTYLSYGLRDRLLTHLAASGAAVSPSVALDAARELSREGAYRESVVALNYYEASGGVFNREAAELRYPRAFAALVDRAARDEGVDPWVLYALAREESLFDPEVVSVAGAVGLTQLLPSTAEDIARRMRFDDDPVLTDPADNIAIGARYFAMLTQQFGTPARAIAAYNGGQGNVRRWERRTPLLDELLFHQLIPFEETYNHVRKVVVSSAYYGYLYGDRTPAETVAMIFDLSLD